MLLEELAMEIAINPEQRRYLSSKVRSGQFKSASEVVKYALNRLKQDERDAAWLKRRDPKRDRFPERRRRNALGR